MNKSKNLHLFFSDLVLETRLFKEAEYTLKSLVLSEVYALGKSGQDKLPVIENHSSGLKIVRLRLLIDLVRSYVISRFKVFRLIFIAFSLVQYGLFACHLCYKLRAGIISIHNLPLLPLGCLIKLVFRTKLVYLPHELETERSGVRGILKYLLKITEKLFIGYADHTVTVCSPISDWYRNAYQLKNVHTVRNAPNSIQLSKTHEVTNLRDKFNITDEDITYIYQGLISNGRGISLVIESFKKAKKHIVFMGHGDLIEKVTQDESRYINYLAPVPAYKICAQTCKADVGIHVNQDKSLSYKYSLPNKFFEYMHSGIPIIVSSNMELLSDLVRSNNLGWVIDPEDLSELLAELEKKDIADKIPSVLDYASSAIYELDAKVFNLVYGKLTL